MVAKKSQTNGLIAEQVNAEFYAAYLYLQLSADASDMSWNGAAGWLRAQAAEEITHAMKLYDYLLSRDVPVTLTEIKKPSVTSSKTLLDLFKAAYGHEVKVTAMINRIFETASAEKDHAAANMIQWFIAEQVEEEENTKAVVDDLTKAGTSVEALFFIDKMLGRREDD
jgi:ferritin